VGEKEDFWHGAAQFHSTTENSTNRVGEEGTGGGRRSGSKESPIRGLGKWDQKEREKRKKLEGEVEGESTVTTEGGKQHKTQNEMQGDQFTGGGKGGKRLRGESGGGFK